MPRRLSFKRIVVVANPAAGADVPVLATLNSVFQDKHVHWDVRITHGEGDAAALASAAAKDGADLVAGYGGDGTVMEVASGLLGTRTTLGILPGGTANVLARDLGIPLPLAESAALLVGPHRLRPLDVGVSGDRHFVLRLAVGWEAEMDIAADREAKDRIGMLAYPAAAISALRDLPVVRYALDIDGAHFEADGVNCVVANSGSFGVAGLALAPDIDVSDGHLDVAVLQGADLASLLTVAKDVVTGQVPDRSKLVRWTGREVRVSADPPQRVVVDGESAGETPVEASVVPAALKVVVPV